MPTPSVAAGNAVPLVYEVPCVSSWSAIGPVSVGGAFGVTDTSLDSTPVIARSMDPTTARTLNVYAVPLVKPVAVREFVASLLLAMSVQAALPCLICHLVTPELASHDSTASVLPPAPVSVGALGWMLMLNSRVSMAPAVSVAM